MIAVFLFLSITIAAIFFSSSVSWFIDLQGILTVFGLTLSGLLGKYGFRFFQRSSQELLDSAGVFSLLGGILASIIGLIIMLQNLSDPSSIGPAMAVAMLTTFYGLVIFAICKLARRVK